jgi:hypothetical protein
MRNLILVLLLTGFLAAPVLAQEVEVGVYVLNLGRFDVGTGAFTADFYLSMVCSDDCTAVDFEFMNGRASSVDRIIDNEEEKFYRIQAQLTSPVDLREFPFDKQRMQIIIEDKSQTIDELVFVADEDLSGIDESITFTGWRLSGWNAEELEHEYGIYDETFSQYVFSIDIERIKWNSFLKTFLPVMFITLVVLFSFLIDPDKIAVRLGTAGSSLVAAVMFHVSITNQIPPVGYLTFADKFMVLTYFVLLMAFIINIALLDFQQLKKEKLVDRIHRRTKYTVFVVVPLLYLVLFLLG